VVAAAWLEPIAPVLGELAPLAQAGRWRDGLDCLNRLARARGIANAQDQPVCFIDAAAAPDLPYESQVWQSGRVPTRTGQGAWHDFLNALIWLTFPLTKARLNALQAQAIARDGVGSQRGSLRDAATLFDENAALVIIAPGPLLEAWRAHDWQRFLVAGGSAAARQWRPLLFGHALLDKLRAPYAAICAHAWVVSDADLLQALARPDPPACAELVARLDAVVAGQLCDTALRRDAFLPLPVLGVPGWWSANTQPGFYDDTSVFRPAPRR
jgi:hypothetical protein